MASLKDIEDAWPVLQYRTGDPSSRFCYLEASPLRGTFTEMYGTVVTSSDGTRILPFEWLSEVSPHERSVKVLRECRASIVANPCIWPESHRTIQLGGTIRVARIPDCLNYFCCLPE